MNQLEMFPTDPSSVLRAHANKLTEIKAQKQKIEDELKKITEQEKTLEEKIIPQLMDDFGFSEITFQDGTKCILSEFPVGKITAETMAGAYAWLRANNHEGIIKNVVEARFIKGQDEDASTALAFFEARGIPAEKKETIHYQTLQSFIREQADSPDFPRDLFNVFEVKKAVFK